MLFALLLPFVAAHLGDGGGRAPFVVDGVLAGGGTAAGLVLGEGGAWLRTCEEASGGVPQGYFRTTTGEVLAATPNGLVATSDGGCTWAPVDGVLRNLEVSDIEVARGAPEIVFLTTSRAGAPNSLWRSDDGGASFSETSLAGVIHPLLDVAVAADGSTVAVTGFDLDDETPLLRVSADGGSSFVAPTAGALPLLAAARVRALHIDEATDRLWLTVLDENGAATLAHASLALDDLVPVQAFPGDVLALALLGADRFVLARPDALYRQADAIGAFVIVDGVSLECLSAAADASVLWGCATANSGVQFLRSTDGIAWSVALADADLVDRACADDTPAATACALPDAGPLDPHDPPRDGGPPDDGGRADAGAVQADDGAGRGSRVAPDDPAAHSGCSASDGARTTTLIFSAGTLAAGLVPRMRRRRQRRA